MQPSPTVREMGNLILNGGSTSPSKNATPTPKELFGSSTSFPARDQLSTPGPGYRGSLDLDRLPNLLPPLRNLREGTPPPNPSNALTAVKDFKDFKEFNLPPLPRDRDRDDWARDRERDRGGERDRGDGPKFSIHDFETITSQLSGLTSIANSLQREMTNLSRRSKDNATDLISLKEATKSRDEDIRQSLRDLVHGLHTIESDRLLTNSSIPLITSGASTSSRSSSYASDNYNTAPGTRGIDKSGLEMAALERVLREMSTKDEQDRVIDLLRDIQDTINKPQLDRLQNEEKILSLLEDFKEREYAKGKELAIPGEVKDRAMDEQILSILEHIRDSVYEKEEKESDGKILALLEEMKERGENSQVISLLEELREQRGDSRINAVLSSLEELKGEAGNERVLSLLEDIKARTESMKEVLANSLNSAEAPPGPSPRTQDAPGTASMPHATETSDIFTTLRDLKEGVESGGEATKNIQKLLDDWKERWAGHDREAHAALKDLMKEIEILVTEQRHAISRLHNSSGLQSTALTMTNPPAPPDLDNEAAITALANIASTTTRTDITLSSINALIKVFHKDMNAANTHTHESVLNVSRFLENLGDTIMNVNSQAGETRKTLEVVRSGVGSGNDRLAEFECAALRKIEELMYLHKHLQKTMLNSGDELVWKQDVGVRAVVEEFQSDVEELLEKNLDAVKESAEKTLEAVNNSNPASLIAELKRELGAMAERSLAAFAAADSKEALAELKTELQRSIAMTVEAIGNSDPTDSIEQFEMDVKELFEKSLTATESGSSKVIEELARLGDATPTKAVIEDLKSQLEELIKGSFGASNEQTSVAIADLKRTIVDKPDGSEHIQGSIDQLKAEITELMEKSMTALAPPASFPEAETIKARVGALAHEITKTMDNTIALFSDSSVETDEKLKKAVDELKAELNEMEKSISESISSNSASGLATVITDSIKEMKSEIAEQIVKHAEVSERSLTSSMEASGKMACALEDLKTEVSEMVEKSITMAVGTPDSGASTTKIQEAVESLRADISKVMDNSFATASSSDDVKTVLEDLRKQITEMMEKSMSMVLPPPVSDEATKEMLEAIRKDIASILDKTLPSPESSINDIKGVIEDLRKEVGETVDKLVSMVVPRTTTSDGVSPGSAEKIEKVLDNLKSEIGEMVQHSLAAAIANSTFDSEETVKEAIEVLKRDVRDTVQLSMMPLPADNTEAAEQIRVVLQGLKSDLGNLLEAKLAAPNVATVEAIDSLRAQVGALAESAKRDEMNGIMEQLKTQVEELAESGSEEVLEAVEELKKGMTALVEKLDNSTPANMAGAVEDLKKEVEKLSGKSDDALEALRTQVERLDIKDTIEALKAHVEGLSGISGVPISSELPRAPKDDDFKDSMEALKRDIEEVMEKSMGSLVASKPDDTEVREWIGALKEEMVVYVEKSLQAIKGANPSEAIEGLRRDVREAMQRSGHHIPHEPERTQVGEKVEKIKEAFEELRKVVEKNSATDPATRSSLEEGVENVKIATSELKQDLSAFRAEEKESIADITSAVGECRVEVAVVKTLVEEKHTEVKDSITGFATAVDESNAELKDTIECVQEAVEGLQAASNELITGLADSLTELGTDTKGGINSLNTSLSEVHAETKEGIASVSKVISELHLEVKGGISSVNNGISETKETISGINQAITDSTTETKGAIGSLREIFETVKSEIKENLNDVGEAVKRTGAEAKETTAGFSAMLEASQSDISDTKTSIKESQNTVQTALADINASVEGRVNEVRDDVYAVKKAVEESSTTATHEHRKTQKQIEGVFGLVDGLQSDLKGQQPTLLNTLLELKHLLQEAHKEIAKKPDAETFAPPPAYDDSQVQEKLNTLIAGNTSAARFLPQLSLIGSIQKQVSATSADIAEFLSMQKEVLLEDASSKIDAARQAEMDLEKAIAEKKIMEAATASLREEQANLQDSVESLKEESQALYARKLKLTGELAGLETALDLRRDELMLLEARAEGLERRVIEGVIEQSRVLLTKSKGNGSRTSKADTSATLRKIHHSPAMKSGSNGRRNLSLNQIQNETPTSASKSGRASLSGSTLGLGQKEYSASLGLLKRSHSTKSVGTSERRQSSWGQKISRAFSGTAGKENDATLSVNEEEAGEYGVDEGADVDDMDDVDAELERLMREQVELGLVDGRRSSSGSVRRMAADDEEGGDKGKRKSKAYPGLDLDFSDEPMSRSISGNSNRV